MKPLDSMKATIAVPMTEICRTGNRVALISK